MKTPESENINFSVHRRPTNSLYRVRQKITCKKIVAMMIEAMGEVVQWEANQC